MTKVYKVTTTFFDNGEIRVSGIAELECDKVPANEYKELATCDKYIDYFTDKAQADKFYQSCFLN